MGVHPHERRCGHARRQPEHAALLGAPLRLPRAAAHGRAATGSSTSTEIEALRAAFEETHNVSSAIAIARERGTGPASPGRACAAPSAASTRARPTASSRRASPSARSSARSRRSCSRASRRSTRRRRRRDAPSSASPGAGRRAGWPRRQRVAPPATRPEAVADLRRQRALRPRLAPRPGARAVPAPRAACAR